MMVEHVAILRRRYVRLILRGLKTMESRLTRTARAPYGQVSRGDRIYFRAVAGPYMATARAGRVWLMDGLDPGKVRAIFDRWNDRILADEAYRAAKENSRYATLIELYDVQAVSSGPAMGRSRGVAWFVLGERKDDATRCEDVMEFALTAGALRNGYVRPGAGVRECGTGFELVLPDGRKVWTEVTAGGMIRWRGWGWYYRRH